VGKRGRPPKPERAPPPANLAQMAVEHAGMGLGWFIGRASPGRWKTAFTRWKTKYGRGADEWELEALRTARPGGSVDDIERWRQLFAGRGAAMEEIGKLPARVPPPTPPRVLQDKLKRAAAALTAAREALSDLPPNEYIPRGTMEKLEHVSERVDVWKAQMEGAHLPHEGGAKDLHITRAAAEFAFDLLNDHICTPTYYPDGPYCELARLLVNAAAPDRDINPSNQCRKFCQEVFGTMAERRPKKEK
jgi:hypothetical protein